MVKYRSKRRNTIRRRKSNASRIYGGAMHDWTVIRYLNPSETDNVVYYHNTATGETRWRIPDELYWIPNGIMAKHSDGSDYLRTYYYNPRSGESSWVLPNDFYLIGDYHDNLMRKGATAAREAGLPQADINEAIEKARRQHFPPPPPGQQPERRGDDPLPPPTTPYPDHLQKRNDQWAGGAAEEAAAKWKRYQQAKKRSRKSRR
jgi:hypothetical protein